MDNTPKDPIQPTTPESTHADNNPPMSQAHNPLGPEYTPPQPMTPNPTTQPNTVEHTDSPVQTPPPSPHPDKKPKILFIVVGLILLIGLVVAIWFVMANRKAPTPENVTPDTSQDQPAPVDTTSVQSGVSQWLLDMQTTPGTFNQIEDCAGSADSCQMQNPIQDILAMWATYQYSQSNNDTETMSQIQENMSNLTLTPQPWACRSLYQLSQTDMFSEADIASMQSYCQAQGNAPTQAFTQEEILAQMQNIVTNESTSSAGIYQTEDVSGMFTEAAVQASDNAVNGVWNGAGNEAALSSFGQALTLYQSDDNMTASSASLLGVAALDMYYLTETVAYLDFAEFIFNNYVPQSCSSLEECANMIYLAQGLYDATGGTQYQELENILAHSVITQSFDGPGGVPILGMNAFYNGDASQTMYPTRQNALLLGTFAQN